MPLHVVPFSPADADPGHERAHDIDTDNPGRSLFPARLPQRTHRGEMLVELTGGRFPTDHDDAPSVIDSGDRRRQAVVPLFRLPHEYDICAAADEREPGL